MIFVANKGLATPRSVFALFVGAEVHFGVEFILSPACSPPLPCRSWLNITKRQHNCSEQVNDCLLLTITKPNKSTDNPYEFAMERNSLILTQKILDHTPLFVIKRHSLLEDSL